MGTAVGESLVRQDIRQEEPFEQARQQQRWDLEQNLMLEDTVVKNLILNVVKDHVPGLDIGDSLIVGDVIRDITAASQVSLTVHDQARTIVNHEGFYDDVGRLRTIDINLDGMWFRLTKLDKQGDDAVFTFEDREIARLRDLKGPRKAASRAKTTRAEYILQLIRASSKRIPVRINELHKKQPIAKFTEEERGAGADARRTKKKRDASRSHGFPAGFKMKGVTTQMLDNMVVALDEAENVMDQRSIKGDIHERVLLIMLVAGWGESGWLKSAAEKKYGTHKGVFQSNQIPPDQLRTQAHYFTIGGKSFASGGAIAAARNKTMTVGAAAAHVEVSDGSAAYYDSFFKKARKILDAWGGGSSGTVTRRKRYEFKVDNRESYWDAIQRMASEVNWRAFFSAGIFYYISETDLLKSRARYRFSESSDGVINIDFSIDRRKARRKATATVHINRWAIPPGICVQIDDLGPASGKWLVQSVSRSLFSSEATLSLVSLYDSPEKVEPHPGYIQSTKEPGSGGGAVAGDPIPATGGVAPPLAKIIEHSHGWLGRAVHDGVDLICNANASIYAICDAEVIDVRDGGWWGKNPTGDVSKGDGIIQLRCLIDNGPFKKDMHFGYGHAEKATVQVGDRVQAGDMIGHAGFANAWHVHFMANAGDTSMGIGDRDPWPYVQYAISGQAKKRIRTELLQS